MPNEHHVFVYRDNCSFRVAPPHLLAGHGDRIVFHATNPITVFFPRWVPLVIREGDREGTWEVFPPERTPVLTVSSAAPPGRYPYAVYCEGDFAKGGSDPEILIYG